MLVLSRHVGESVVIGDDVVVTVLDVRGDVVRLGVAAPRSIAVHRQELLEEIARTNADSASPSDADVSALRRAVAGNRSREDREAPATGAPRPGSPRPGAPRPGAPRPGGPAGRSGSDDQGGSAPSD